MNKMVARKTHRALARIVAVGLILFTLTGILLNHTEDLALDKIKVSNPLILNWYGINKPVISKVLYSHNNWVTEFNQRVYINKTPTSLSSPILKVNALHHLMFILQPTQLSILTEDGALIDSIALPKTPEFKTKNRQAAFNLVGNKVSNQLYLVQQDTDKSWILNEDMTRLIEVPVTDIQKNTGSMTLPPPLPAPIRAAILNEYQSPLTLEKVILEFHNGYILGAIGPWLLDSFALLSIIMIWTGLRLRSK